MSYFYYNLAKITSAVAVLSHFPLHEKSPTYPSAFRKEMIKKTQVEDSSLKFKHQTKGQTRRGRKIVILKEHHSRFPKGILSGLIIRTCEIKCLLLKKKKKVKNLIFK